MPEFVPIAGEFVARCADIDLARPLYEEHRREIVAAMDRFGVCVFNNEAPVSDEHHLAFGREFGPLLRQRMQQTVSGRGIRLSTDELIDVGNLDENGDIHAADDPRRAFHKGNLLWHSDVTFDPVRATYSLLAAHVVPPDGGDTEFADMKAAYVDLSEDVKQRIEGLTA